MNSSGSRTHNLILDTALKLFSEKGYEAVTMSDFCNECHLSRGGLYRHFGSTAEIFEAMLERDKDDWSLRMETSIGSNVPAVEMLRFYFESIQKSILHKEGRLSLAAYECVRSNESFIPYSKKRYNSAVDLMKQLLDYGNSRDEFHVSDTAITARQLVVFIDGLSLAAIFSMTSAEVSDQIAYIYKSITGEEL